MSNVLLVAVGAALEQRIMALQDNRVIIIDRERSTDLDGLRRTGESFVPDIIFFGANVPASYGLKYAETMQASQPTIPIILIGELNAESLLRAMRAGVRDVMPVTVEDDEILRALLKVQTSPAANGAPGATGPNFDAEGSRVVVVASPKGGVGKTTLAANLAVAFAQAAPMNTVLIDLDLQFGDASTVLDLKPSFTLADAFSKAAEDTLLLKTYLTVHPAGFFVLCGADSPADTEKVTGGEITRLIKQLSSQFKYVVIDTAAGIPEATLASLEEATDIVLVSSMDVSCIRALKKEIDLLRELSLMPTNRHVVLNYVDRRSGMTIRDVEAVIGLPVNVAIPRSDEVQIAANRGEPVMLRKKSGPVQKAIRTLVARFQPDMTPNKLPAHHKGVDLS